MGRAGCSEDLSWERQSCFLTRRLGPAQQCRDGSEQGLGRESASGPRLHVLEMVSCRNNNEQQGKRGLAVLLSASPSPFQAKIVHKTSFYTNATSQDDFEYWTHLWQLNVCVCAHVSFTCVSVSTHVCACIL